MEKKPIPLLPANKPATAILTAATYTLKALLYPLLALQLLEFQSQAPSLASALPVAALLFLTVAVEMVATIISNHLLR